LAGLTAKNSVSQSQIQKNGEAVVSCGKFPTASKPTPISAEKFYQKIILPFKGVAHQERTVKMSNILEALYKGNIILKYSIMKRIPHL
jgi:hypothetical protein